MCCIGQHQPCYVNLIMNEYAYYGKGHTIQSSGQIEWHKNIVDDKSVKVGGSQCITTLDGYSFHLKYTGGLMYLSILGKPTDEELVKYSSVHLTSIHEWDPSVLDFSYPDRDGEPVWTCDPQYVDLIDPNFDPQGLYTKRAINTLLSLADVHKIPPIAMFSSTSPTQACKHQIKSETPDFDNYRPYFGWVNADIIKETFKHTTQWGASITTCPMKKHLKSRNPALTVPRRHEAVAADTVYADTPAIDSGVKMAQLFVGKESLVSDIYPMRSGKQFVNTMEDKTHRHGAMDKLSDSAKNEISHKVKDILRAYNINDWQSEPYHQNQNPAESRYRTIKAWTNTIMNRTGAPAHCWLVTLQYVCYILGEKSAQSDTPTVYIKSRHHDGPTSSKPLPGFNPDDLVGRTFLLPPGDNGQRLRAKVTRKVVEDIEQADGERVQKLSFILGIGNGKLEEIIFYNQLVDH